MISENGISAVRSVLTKTGFLKASTAIGATTSPNSLLVSERLSVTL